MKFWWFLLLCFSVNAQVSVNKTSINLGDLFAASERFEDISIRNNSPKAVYILRVVKPATVAYKADSDKLPPDSTMTLRVQLNPATTGKVSEKIQLYLSDRPEPIAISISANVRELPQNNLAALQDCPEFGVQPSRVRPTDLTIITVDEESREPLSKSTITILRNGSPQGSFVTDRKGSVQQQSVPGYYYFHAVSAGYLPKEAGAYVGPAIREITIPLKKALTTEIEHPQEIVVTTSKTSLDTILQAEIPTTIVPELAELPRSDFSEEHFKPVNVVFVIDISGSMKTGDKMELMKYALNQLVDVLRPQDRVALVTYADDAETLIEPTSGADKGVLKEQVSLLKADGLTAGGKGIKLGYKQAMKQYATDKANMVVIITDGAFNRSSDDYQKVVRKYADKGVTFSVVGIQDRKSDEEKMQEAASFGRGRYVSIDKLADAHVNLTDEIRQAAYRGK